MKLMVALDESEGSFYALKWALTKIIRPCYEIDEDDKENKVYLIHVSPPFQTYVYPAGPVVYTTAAVLDSVKHAQEQISAAIFSRALQCCQENMIKAETKAIRGDPKEMICQAADQMHVDLLVVGSRGLGMLKRAFLGSVSDYCVHHAHCPVLIVKPPKEHADNQADEPHQRKV